MWVFVSAQSVLHPAYPYYADKVSHPNVIGKELAQLSEWDTIIWKGMFTQQTVREGSDKIYSLGSYRCNPMCTEQAEAYQYVVSTNTWSPFPSLSSSSSSIGCAITRRGGTGKRMIIISGDLRYIQSFDLVTGTAWSRLQYYEQYGWDRPKLVSVTPWEVYKMGGSCSGCGYG